MQRRTVWLSGLLLVVGCGGATSSAGRGGRTLQERQALAKSPSIDPARGIFGQLECGMPKSEAASLDGATMRSMSVKLDGYHGTIYETEGNVVASIATSKRDDYEGVTAEAIGIDSTRQEVEDSYPDLIVGKIDEKGTQYLTVFQKGWPSALRLRFDWSPEQRKAGASVEEGDVPEMLFRMSLSCGYVPPASATVPSGS